MGTNSNIDWTDHTWNPWRGCIKVSPGCDNCYMMRDAKRFGMDGTKVVRAADKTFLAPLTKIHEFYKWEAREKVFVCSWSDFFHPDADAWRAGAWNIIGKRTDLIFLILTKRFDSFCAPILARLPADWGDGWPHVWLGVTAENQEMADTRISALLSIPAAKRFVSIEPMLEPIDLTRIDYFRSFNATLTPERRECAPSLKWNALSNDDGYNDAFEFQTGEYLGLLDWVIVGGETGPNARDMNPDWARSIRDQCREAGVPFFMKQMTKKAPIPEDLRIREYPHA